jgi:predicted nucleic acid-binding protein
MVTDWLTVSIYLIDTSIFLYLFRSDPIIDRYADDLAADAELFLSVQTVGELRAGAEQRQWGAKRRARL